MATISLVFVLLTVACIATATPVDTPAKAAEDVNPVAAPETEAKSDLKTSETLGLGLVGFPSPLYYGSYYSRPYRYYSYPSYRRYSYGYGYGYPYYSYNSYYDWPYHYF